MSYLGPLRLHFAGRFQATVSTVNNSSTNFDTARFRPEFRDQGNQGSWNPQGDADWRLLGCAITAATMADGSPAGADDPVLEWLIADSDRRAPAKLVDLDPQQQMCSMVFGLEMRVCDRLGETLVVGRFEPTAFTELWQRARQGGGADPPLGAFYQSVLTDLEWRDGVDASPMLMALKDAAGDGLLSVKYNVDGYNWTPGSPTFGQGRLVGTLGPATAAEPRHFVAGRQFLPSATRKALSSCAAVVDEALGQVFLDLGNALPTTTVGGPLADIGPVTLTHAGGPIGIVPYTEPLFYERTAGVVALPAGRRLTAEELASIAAGPLSIEVGASGIDEAPGGLYARADQFVFRNDPGDVAQAKVFATRFGRPLADAAIATRLDPSRLQGGEHPPGQPPGAVRFPASVTTGADGTAALPITVTDPGNPRVYIDGQVYGVRPALAQAGAAYPPTPWNFISLLVWDTFQADEPPTWHGSFRTVFQQYRNLYPVMDGFLDLSDYASVCRHRKLLLLAFGLPIEDPNSMPVSRDLSGSARAAILRWLTEVGPDGNPLLGTPPATTAAPSPTPPAAPAAALAEPPPSQGKMAAQARMIGEPDQEG